MQDGASVSTVWDDSFQSFKLYIPRQAPNSARLSSSLDQEFERFFGGGQADAPPRNPIDEEDWAHVEEQQRPPPANRGTSACGTRIVTRSAGALENPKALPAVTTLARPGELFHNASPYILIVELGNPLLVQSSHQRSLELLAQYLNKWGRPNKNDAQRVSGIGTSQCIYWLMWLYAFSSLFPRKRNVFTVDLIESDFAVGVNDALRIEPTITYGRTGPINPAMVLAFVEGVLGFQVMHASGDRIVYRSSSALL